MLLSLILGLLWNLVIRDLMKLVQRDLQYVGDLRDYTYMDVTEFTASTGINLGDLVYFTSDGCVIPFSDRSESEK
jgi:hypothetical protein